MTKEQKQYIEEWVAKVRTAKEERWLERMVCCYPEPDSIWEIDEESYQMKKFLKSNIDVENLSEELKSLVNEATSLCSYVDEYCEIILYETPFDWENPKKR